MPPSPDPDHYAELLGGDPQARRELEAARAWGVSWRRFLGWEPATTTVYEYDPQGRLARSVTTTEPEWDAPERAVAVGLLVYEAGLCPGCRQPLAETTDPARENTYRAGLAIRCHRCTATERAGETYQDSPQPGALLIPVEETE